MAVCSCVLIRSSHPLKVCGKPFWPTTGSTGSTLEIWRKNETEGITSSPKTISPTWVTLCSPVDLVYRKNWQTRSRYYSTLPMWLNSNRSRVSVTHFYILYRNSHAELPRWAAGVEKDHDFPLARLNNIAVAALKALQHRLQSPTNDISILRPNGRYTLDNDGSDKQAGCVLLQEQLDKPANPLWCGSELLKKAEKACDTTHRECLAFVLTFLQLRPYFEGSWLTIWTEHDALQWILKMKDARVLAR